MRTLTVLLAALFTTDELLRFFRFRPGGQHLVAQINPTWSLQALCEGIVLLLERRSELNASLFSALVDAFPLRRAEILAVAGLYANPVRGQDPNIAAVPSRGTIRGSLDLEISIERGARSELYSVDLFSIHLQICRPSEAEARITLHGQRIERAALLACMRDPVRHGQLLTQFLFGSAEASAMLAHARSIAEYLRIRLAFDPTSNDLQIMRWETLCDPELPGVQLLRDARIHFSRYLGGTDWRPVKLRPRASLSALVALAVPEPPGTSDSPVNWMSTALGGRMVSTLTFDEASQQPASLSRVVAGLRVGPDLFYLMCGCSRDEQGQPILCLSDGTGALVQVYGLDFVKALMDLELVPRVVVLVHESAGDPHRPIDDGGLMTLAPRLIEVGVAAVLVVEGQISRETLSLVMAKFLRELASHGVVDHAMAVGRLAAGASGGSWQFVLFTRLRSGRIWYDAGFGSGGLGTWDAIRMKIEDSECTPIIGPGLFETLYEIRPWLARRWSREYLFPLAATQREDLTVVSQYLASQQGPDFPHRRLIRDLPLALRERLGLPGEAQSSSIAELLTALRVLRFTGRPDPYRILADLPLRVFILGCHDPMFVQALHERGKNPQVGLMPWRRGLRSALPRSYQPTVDEPLVYCLFGSLDVPRSLVLTQDDYVDFLLSVQHPDVREMIPKVVLASLVDTSLLFLGFHIDSWEFRAVFRTIMQQEGMASSCGPHVAAQIEPEEGRVIDPTGARAYFERYLRAVSIDIYWGTTEGFLVDLVGRAGGEQS